MSEAWVVEEDSPESKYFTQASNIIFHLGLDAYEIAMFFALKRTAGDRGKSFKGVRTLAKEAGMGKTKASQVIITLAKPRPTLGGKSLIAVKTKPKVVGGQNIITVTNIMPENIMFFEEMKTTKMGGESQNKHGEEVSAKRTPCPSGEQGVRQMDNVSAIRTGCPSNGQKKNNKEEQLGKTKKEEVSEHAFGLAALLLKKLKEINPKHRQPNMQNWAFHVERMLQIDNRSPAEIKSMIEWLPTESFWIKNIQSPAKLREKFDTLWITMMSSKPKSQKSDEKADLFKKNRSIAETYHLLYAHRLDGGKIFSLSDNYATFRIGRSAFPLGFSELGFEEQLKNILIKFGVI